MIPSKSSDCYLKKKKKIVHSRHIYKLAVQYSEILNKEEDIGIQVIVTKQ
jgi:hypothetical protein